LEDIWNNTWGILGTILGGYLRQYLGDNCDNTWGIIGTILRGYLEQYFGDT
jgi:hypothetical protein